MAPCDRAEANAFLGRLGVDVVFEVGHSSGPW